MRSQFDAITRFGSLIKHLEEELGRSYRPCKCGKGFHHNDALFCSKCGCSLDASYPLNGDPHSEQKELSAEFMGE